MYSLLWREFSEINKEDLYALLKLRADVFVLEQRSLFQDIDDLDQLGLHLLLLSGEKRIAGTLRLVPNAAGDAVTIGRVVLAREARGLGQGRRMLAASLEKIEERWVGASACLSAQAVQQRFYASFGFVQVSAPYDDAGILHIEMRREG